MREKKVLAVVLSYNSVLLTGELFIKTIQSLKEQDHKELDVIVVDNCSKDNSIEEINEKFPGLRVIRLKKNKATMGYNKGIEIFLKNDYDYLLLCNNDIIFEKDFISSMAEFADKIPEAGLITPRMMMLSDKNIYNSTGIVINRTGFAWDRNFNERESDIGIPKSSEAAAASGGAMFCTKSAINAVKGFDPLYHAYYEDVDFSVRMKRKTNLRIFYNSKAVCYHAFSKSWGENPLKEFFMIRNMYIFVLTHFKFKMAVKSMRFFIFNVKHNDEKLNRKIFFSLFILSPLILARRIKYSFMKPLQESELENFAGFPDLSNK